MVLYSSFLKLPLFLIYSHMVFTRDSDKIALMEKRYVVNTTEIFKQNVVPLRNLFSFQSEINKKLGRTSGCSDSERILKWKTVKRGRQGIGFPSLEASLLSLAFLTFAVFLVNLIQALIKTMQGN